jgi:hypothetical protein
MTVAEGAVAGIASAVKFVDLYGVHQDLGYVSNEQSRHASIDFPIIANRQY